MPWAPMGQHKWESQWYRGNASKIKTRVYVTLAVCVVRGCVLVPGLCTAVFACTPVVLGARRAHWGYRSTRWQAGPEAEAPVLPPWHDRRSCGDPCPQSQPQLGKIGLGCKKIFLVPQLSSSVSCIYSLLLFHILKKPFPSFDRSSVLMIRFLRSFEIYCSAFKTNYVFLFYFLPCQGNLVLKAM